MKPTLTPIQREAVSQLARKPLAILICPTGGGKTAIILHHIAAHPHHRFLITAPPAVITHWPKEAAKWGLNLQIVPLQGTPRTRTQSIKKNPKANAYVVSLNSLTWALGALGNKVTAVVIDELSKAPGKHSKALRQRGSAHIKHRIGMTATPVAESFEKMYGMARIIDSGKALGTIAHGYLNTYFRPLDFKGYRHELLPGADTLIMEKIQHLLIDVPYSKHTSLPRKDEEELVFTLPAATRELYNEMKQHLLLEHTQANTATVAVNLAVLSGKLRQLASGFSIAENGTVIEYDTKRAETAINRILELNSQPVVVIYEYDHQRVQLQEVAEDHNVSYVSVCGGSDKDAALAAFKSNKVHLLIAQQNTLSHGVDGLQHTCSQLMFLQPLWSADTTEQAIGRIWRQGQHNPVTITYIVADNTLDDLVLQRVEDKAVNMRNFLKFLRGK